MNPILSRFEATVAAFPQKRAVACGDECFTFSELQGLSARLGTAIGPEPGAVGVLVHRSAVTAALFFGALYAGGCYVPLDPDMPEHKLQTVLQDAGIRVLLGAREDLPLLERVGFTGCFLTPEDAGEIPVPAPEAGPDTPLYMVYTSGSTGKPKGVRKSHGAMCSFIDAFRETFSVTDREIIGNQNPFFFDAAAKDLYLMACTGATLEVIPSEKFIFPVRLIEYLNERQISYVCWVPTALAIVTQLNTFRQVLPTTLEKVLFVGEVFPVKQLHKWLEALPDLRYVNLYGSSELAGICCYYEIPKGARPEQLPMGKPLSNCRVYLRGEDGFVTQPGQLGEVWVESPALALEYFGDPEKTAATFCEEVLPEGRVARVLKTGDLARYDGEGNLVFSSRKDFQIKHMGRRIELGEIEAAADALPELARCCCLYNDQKKRIELFCQLTEGAELDGKAVQSLLRGRLSDYMLPSKVHILPALPINPNGKINRTALKEQM